MSKEKFGTCVSSKTETINRIEEEEKMQKILWNGIKQSIAIQFPPKLVNSCILTRSASSQISSQKWLWFRQPPSLSITNPSSSYLHFRCYSIDNDNQPEQQIPNTERKIPKMSDTQIQFSAAPFSFIVLNFKAFKIRKYDADFSINEFVEGSKKAVEVRALTHFCFSILM